MAHVFAGLPFWASASANMAGTVFSATVARILRSIRDGRFLLTHITCSCRCSLELGGVGLLLILVMLFGWFRQFLGNWMTPTSWPIATSSAGPVCSQQLRIPTLVQLFPWVWAAVFLGLGDTRTLQVKFTPVPAQSPRPRCCSSPPQFSRSPSSVTDISRGSTCLSSNPVRIRRLRHYRRFQGTPC